MHTLAIQTNAHVSKKDYAGRPSLNGMLDTPGTWPQVPFEPVFQNFGFSHEQGVENENKKAG
jgi:hypothetical protein